MGRSADAAPRANGNVKGRGVGREAVIGRVVTRGGVEGGDSTWGFLVHGGSDFKSDRPAIAIQSGAQTSYAHGPISGADEVFLARPQQVDRSAAVLVSEVDRLFGLRAVAIAAEAAAEVAHVEIDVLFRNAGDLRGREARLLGALVTDPNVHPVVSDKHCRVSGLHPGTREVGRRVGRFDDFSAAEKTLSQSPRLTRTLPGLSMAAISAARMLAVLSAACWGGRSHSIGIISSAVLAWYQVSPITATPPLKTRSRIRAGSGIGNCSAEMTPGWLRIRSKS